MGFRSRTIAQLPSVKQGFFVGLIFSFRIVNPDLSQVQAWRGEFCYEIPSWANEAEQALKINPTFWGDALTHSGQNARQFGHLNPTEVLDVCSSP